MNGKYFPNNYDLYKDTPAEDFSPTPSWEEFVQWKLAGWELPSSVTCILRAEHVETGKIKEHSYQNQKAAENRLLKYLEGGEHEITVVNAESIHLVKLGAFIDEDSESD